MKTRLSYSQISRYTQCGESYRLHYIERLRPKTTTGALLFGSALDNALNDLLMGKSLGKETFEKSFKNQKINNIDTYIPTSEMVIYANADFDADLLTEDDYREITSFTETTKEEATSKFLEIKNKKSSIGFDKLTVDEKRLYNLFNWLSMLRKGFLMLEAYAKKVMPKLTRIHSVQEQVTIENEVGDSIIGFVDLIADVEGYGTVILDNKTSAMEYSEDSVLTSPQLSMYTHILSPKYKTRKAGYIVMRKNVIKNRTKVCSSCGHDGTGGRHKTCNNETEEGRCGGEWAETISPEIAIQFIVDEIPERTETIVMENTDAVNDGIKNNVFTRNLSMCKNYYGGMCPYFDLCYKNKKTGLESV